MLIHTQNNPTMPGRNHIEWFFIPPIFRVALKSQLCGLREREKALPLEISENRPLYFCPPLCGYGGGKKDWSREREEREERPGQTERSMPDCSTKGPKK